MVTTAKNLLTHAEKHNFDGDQEDSYICYMKFFNLMDIINKTPELRQQRAVWSILGGNSIMNETFDIVEKLSGSLEKRYKSKKQRKNVTDFSPVSTEVPQSQSPDMLHEKIKIKERTSISYTQLYELLHRKDSNIMIIDCRPEAEFNESHIIYDDCVNIPENILNNGMSAVAIKNQLSSKQKSLWSERTIKDILILIDRNSPGPVPELNTSLYILYNILKNVSLRKVNTWIFFLN